MSEPVVVPPGVPRAPQPEMACMAASLRRTANLVTRIYNAYLAPAGLEITQYSILRKIQSGRAESASELADLVGVERSTLARNLDRLAAAGLIAAQTGEGRRIVHRLTEEGEARLVAALPLWTQAQHALAETLPAGQAAAIQTDLALLRRAARHAAPAG